MAFKLTLALALIAVATAGYAPIGQVYHSAGHNVLVKSEEYDPHPQYKFSYGVDDSLTGDSKSQVEERDGDVVRGEYSLIDADGYKRTVQYTADDINGFNAVVHRQPLVKAVAVAPVAVKHIAPVVQTYAAPAPVVHYAAQGHYAAPTHYAAPAHYAAPSTYDAPAHYSAATHYAAHAQYATPAVVKSYASAVHYAAPTVLKSYAGPSVHYSSPAYSYHH